jgi:predicted nuclease of predicted toxin-antitoxin system
MRFITDHNVSDSVGDWLGLRGHEVYRVRDLLLPDSSDLVIAAMGDELEAIVITWNRDFRVISQRLPTGTRSRFRRLGRISLSCNAPGAVKRLEAVWDYIEFEYQRRQRLGDKRLIIDINDSRVSIVT